MGPERATKSNPPPLFLFVLSSFSPFLLQGKKPSSLSRRREPLPFAAVRRAVVLLFRISSKPLKVSPYRLLSPWFPLFSPLIFVAGNRPPRVFLLLACVEGFLFC